MKSIQIQLSDELMAKLKRLAKHNNMTPSEFIEHACIFYNQFDLGFLGKLEDYYRNSGSTNPLPVILERLASTTLAQRDAKSDAEIEINGVAAPILLAETRDDDRDIWEFYKYQYDNFLRQMTHKPM